jgi:hypothetical protein
MSKGNLFLGFARGKVGDVVFSRQGGEQVTRARNRSPRNPQTALQLTQRVCLKSASSAFSLMQDICNHSFQGLDGKVKNQSRFNQLNVELMRQQLADYINSGDPEDLLTCQETNFSQRQSSRAPIRPYVVSDGTLSPLACEITSRDTVQVNVRVSGITVGTAASYQNIVDAFGLQRGDQLTFIAALADDTETGTDGMFNGFVYARVVLDPANGDMTTPFVDSGVIQQPNPRNSGTVTIATASSESGLLDIEWDLSWGLPGTVSTLGGAAVIVSRLNGNVWERSRQSLTLRPSSGQAAFTWDHDIMPLDVALTSYMTAAGSSLYLNQAGNF